MRPLTRAAVAVCAAVLGCLPPASAAVLSDADGRALLDKAVHLFDEGVAQSPTNPDTAQKLFEQSAATFETLREAGFRSTPLLVYLGNAYFRANRLGEAVLQYRRALSAEPRNADARANLEYARRRVTPTLTPSDSAQLWSMLTFWAQWTSRQERFWAAIVLNAVAWLLLLVRLTRRGTWLAASAAALLAVAFFCGLSVWSEVSQAELRPQAVVLEGGGMLRHGRGEGADLVLREPLGAGSEVVILDQRAGWIRVELRNGLRGWLPDRGVARL